MIRSTPPRQHVKQRIIGLTVALALIAAPVEARAQDGFGALGFFILVVAVAEVVVVGGTATTAIGSSIQAGRDEPRLGWSIASLAAGGVGTVWGGIFTYAFLKEGDASAAALAFSLVPLALGLTNIALGSANIVKRSRARRRDAPKLEPEIQKQEEPDWVFAPILLETRRGQDVPGLAAAVRF